MWTKGKNSKRSFHYADDCKFLGTNPFLWSQTLTPLVSYVEFLWIPSKVGFKMLGVVQRKAMSWIFGSSNGIISYKVKLQKPKICLLTYFRNDSVSKSGKYCSVNLRKFYWIYMQNKTMVASLRWAVGERKSPKI